MAACLIFKISIIAALIVGWAAFLLRRHAPGLPFKSLMRVSADG
jgi:hypothetical protein